MKFKSGIVYLTVHNYHVSSNNSQGQYHYYYYIICAIREQLFEGMWLTKGLGVIFSNFGCRSLYKWNEPKQVNVQTGYGWLEFIPVILRCAWQQDKLFIIKLIILSYLNTQTIICSKCHLSSLNLNSYYINIMFAWFDLDHISRQINSSWAM